MTRRHHSHRALPSSAMRVASVAVAVVLATGPLAAAAPAASGVVPSSVPAPERRPVTAWARAVEERLASHVRQAALAGRRAIAWSESGVASWYGGRHEGLRTAAGGRFDPMRLTCAHPTLPLGTRLLVTSNNTGRSVVVTVNDRGPFGGRIVDLSRAAAARIGMLGAGTTSVTLRQAGPDVVEVAQADAADTGAQALAAAGDGAALSLPPRDRPRMPRADR